MSLKKFTFKRGVHIKEFKELSENSSILETIIPKEVYIPLHMHIGAPAECIVKKKDEVKVGQLIAKAQGNFSVNVHSSVSGVVKNILDIQTASGRNAQAVVIQPDDKDEKCFEPNYNFNLNDITKEEIVEKIKECGLVGMGGATFPMHIKFQPTKPVDTVVVNGAECEPYVTCDDTLLKLKPENVIRGLEIAVKAVGAKSGILAIEDNKKEAIKRVIEKLKELDIANIYLKVLKTKYPQGDEKRIIDATLKRVVPSGGLPMDVGVVVTNVSSCNALYEALYLNKPLYERYLTITGNQINEPHNIIAKIGTSMADLIELCGLKTNTIGKLISGGPMMGIAQQRVDAPIEKGTNCILVMTQEETEIQKVNPCIRCSKCVSVCPVGLLPLYIHKFSLEQRYDLAQNYNIMDCIECGSCSYICPSKRPLVEAIRLGKRQIRQAK